MKPLIFKMVRQPEIEVDLTPLTPDGLAGRALAEIRRLPLDAPGQSLCVGDLFEVTAGDRQNIQIRRCSRRVKHIGRGMCRAASRSTATPAITWDGTCVAAGSP